MLKQPPATNPDIALAHVFRIFAARGRALRTQQNETQVAAQLLDEEMADRTKDAQSADTEVVKDASRLEDLADPASVVKGEVTLP